MTALPTKAARAGATQLRAATLSDPFALAGQLDRHTRIGRWPRRLRRRTSEGQRSLLLREPDSQGPRRLTVDSPRPEASVPVPRTEKRPKTAATPGEGRRATRPGAHLLLQNLRGQSFTQPPTFALLQQRKDSARRRASVMPHRRGRPRGFGF